MFFSGSMPLFRNRPENRDVVSMVLPRQTEEAVTEPQSQSHLMHRLNVTSQTLQTSVQCRLDLDLKAGLQISHCNNQT